MNSLAEEKSTVVSKRIGIYRGSDTLNFETATILPVENFLRYLHGGELMGNSSSSPESV